MCVCVCVCVSMPHGNVLACFSHKHTRHIIMLTVPDMEMYFNVVPIFTIINYTTSSLGSFPIFKVHAATLKELRMTWRQWARE